MRKAIIVLLLGAFIFFSWNVTAVPITIEYNFNSTYQDVYAINASSCSSGTLTPASPSGVPPACISFLNSQTNNAALNASDDSDVSLSVSANQEGYFYFVFNLSDIPITSITNLSFAMETDAGASGIYGYSYIYNVSKAEWYQIGYGDMASASDVWLNGDLLSSQHISDFFDGNFTYFLVTESYNNGLTWTLDYVTVKLSYNTAAPAPGLATGNNTNFSTSTPTLSWSNITNFGTSDSVPTYNLQVDDTISFTSISYENYSVPENVNTTNTTTSALSDGIYYWRVRSTTSQGLNSSWSEVRTFRIDTTGPAITIDAPIDFQEFSVIRIDLNISVADSGVGLGTCWYQNNTGANVTVSCNTNISIYVPSSAVYKIFYYSNDTLGNLDYEYKTYTVSTTAPAINLNSPSNDTYFNRRNNIYLNYTATDSNGIDICRVYHNLGGTFALNSTNYDVTSGLMNFTTVTTADDGFFYWNVWCNDSNADSAFSSFNRTFKTDTYYPTLELLPVKTTQGSQTIYFNHTSNDTNLNSCKYSIKNSTGGIDSIYNNLSITCNYNDSVAVVSDFGSYSIEFFSIDYAGNENMTDISFLTEDTPTTLTVVGGGGGSITNQIPVIGLTNINGTKLYSDLERIIIYAVINNYCSEIINKQTLAVVDYSKVCSLSVKDLPTITETLTKYEVLVTENDLKIFIQSYANQKFFQGYTSQENVNKYSLFTSILGITNILNINPPSVDTYIFTYRPSGNLSIPYKLLSNKPLYSCEVLSSTEDVDCSVDNSTISVVYNLKEVNFISKVYSATILVSTDINQKDVEQKRVEIVFRVINLGYNGVLFWSGGAILILALFYIRSRNKKKLKREAMNLLKLSG